MVTCDEPTEKCYFRHCIKCPSIDLFVNLLSTAFSEREIDQISFKQWIKQKQMTLETLVKDSNDFISYLSERIIDLLPHAYIAQEQSKFSRDLKENLKDGEFHATVGYAENFAFVVQHAAPGFHWNNIHATVYG